MKKLQFENSFKPGELIRISSKYIKVWSDAHPDLGNIGFETNDRLMIFIEEYSDSYYIKVLTSNGVGYIHRNRNIEYL